MTKRGTKARPRTAKAALVAVLATVLTATTVSLSVSGATSAAAVPADPRGSHQFADLIEAVKPAVVNISTTLTMPVSNAPMPGFGMPGSPFDEFFRRFQPGPGGPEHKAQGQGSGFIIDEAGYVVTNNHVIANADQIWVTLPDGTRLEAERVGSDPKTDLALLKIDADQSLDFVSFGNSGDARIGDWVIAIGNPFGLGGTATAGIISARGRDIQSGPYDDFIQIDAPINRGNSGGPVFDMNGEVIGVNTAIFSPNGGSVGIGFAIPASQAASVIAELREHGVVSRGWLGVQIQEVTADIADSLGLDEVAGALVAEVSPDSPADTAGLETGDVILGFDGKPVKRIKDLTRLVADTDANAKVRLEIWRQGETRDLRVTIGTLDEPERVAASGPNTKEPAGRLGLSLAPVDDELRARYRLAEDSSGAVITGVRRGSPAAAKGLRAGDIIAMVGQTKVTNPEDVVEEVERAVEDEKESVLLLVQRGGARQFVTLNLA